MKRALLTMVFGAAMVLAPVTAPAAIRVGVGFGPGFYGPGWYAPYWGAYWGPGPYYAFPPNSGQVKLDTKVKDAQVFINGAYAGTTKDNKTMHLRPGSYNIEIRQGGEDRFAEQVYVAPGKTIHIEPAL